MSNSPSQTFLQESPSLPSHPVPALPCPAPPPHPQTRSPHRQVAIMAAPFVSTCAKGAVVGDERLVVVGGSISFEANAIEASKRVVARCVVPTDHRGPQLALIFICQDTETAPRTGCQPTQGQPPPFSCAVESTFCDLLPQPLSCRCASQTTANVPL